MRILKAGCAVLAVLLLVSSAQAATVFALNMTGAKEPDGAGNLGVGDPDALGIGTLTLDPDLDTISWNLVYTGVSGEAISGLHIHGPATPTQNVGVFVGFPLSTALVPDGVQAGLLTSANIADIGTRIDTILGNPSMYYLNLHSSGAGGYPGGAIRTQLPEPGSMALLGIGSLLMARRRRPA